MTEQEKIQELKQQHASTQTNEQYLSEKIDLPSGGKFYSVENPLSKGYVELRFPTAKDEDILTSKSLIQKGTVINAFIESLIVDKNINSDTLIIGDKNSLIFASRILAYGKEYDATITCPGCGEKNNKIIDISSFVTKNVNLEDESKIDFNLFTLKLPASKSVIEYKILTSGNEKDIDAELKGLKQHSKSKVDMEITTRLKYAIVSVDGNKDRTYIRKFVDSMLSVDSLAYRNELKRISPDVDMKFSFECESCDYSERMTMPFGITFFWPSGRD